MSAAMVMYIIASTIAFIAAFALLIAFRQGRTPPTHPGWWIAALTLGGLICAVHTLLAFAIVVQGEGWILIANIAQWCVYGIAILQPRLGAWFYAGTALIIPVLAWLGMFVVSSTAEVMITPERVGGFYSVRSLIIAGLLWLASRPAKHSAGSREPQGN